MLHVAVVCNYFCIAIQVRNIQMFEDIIVWQLRIHALEHYFSCILLGRCEVPLYESSNVCVETCPANQFGNYLTGRCEPCKYFYQVERRTLYN